MEFQWLTYSERNNGQPLEYFGKKAFDAWKKGKQVIYYFY